MEVDQEALAADQAVSVNKVDLAILATTPVDSAVVADTDTEVDTAVDLVVTTGAKQ